MLKSFFPGRSDNALKNRAFGAIRRVARSLGIDFNEAAALLSLYATSPGQTSPTPLELFASAHPSERISFEEPIVALGQSLLGGSRGLTGELAALVPPQVVAQARAASARSASRVRVSSPMCAVIPAATSTAAAPPAPIPRVVTKRPLPPASPARIPRAACWVTRGGEKEDAMMDETPTLSQSRPQLSSTAQLESSSASPSEWVPVGLSYAGNGGLHPATERGAAVVSSLARFAARCGAQTVVFWIPRRLVEGAASLSEDEGGGFTGIDNEGEGGGASEGEGLVGTSEDEGEGNGGGVGEEGPEATEDVGGAMASPMPSPTPSLVSELLSLRK